MKRFWWWAFLLVIPTQLGRHFWPEWSSVMGIRVDYLSPTVYLTDLIWLGVVWSNLSLIKGLRFGKWWWIGLVVLLNIVWAENYMVAIYKWLRWGQWGLGLYLLYKNKESLKSMWGRVVMGWILLESGLALAQVVFGGSLQGVFYWLGERYFSLTTIGIAQMSVGGEVWLRAYGTFSHPNSLAGFLWLSLLIWERERKNMLIRKQWWWAVWWWGVMGIVLAGSRTVWLLLAIYWLVRGGMSWVNYKKKIGMVLVLAGVFVLSWSIMAINYRVSDYLGGWDKAGVEKRIDLAKAAGGMIRDNWLLGVGAGNFLVKLPEYLEKNGIVWLQPVHNIGLLMLSELGIMGSLMVIWWILKNRLIIWRNKKWWWLAVAVTGMVDHYWLTLPQNNWLLALIMVI